jgi:predicted MFS family arabinose efflux permease
MSMVAARYNRKAVMAASLALFLVTGIVSACSPPFWLLLTIRLLPTLLHSAYFAAALAAVISTSLPAKQHKLMAIALIGIDIATVTTVPLSTWLASVFPGNLPS